MDDGPIDSMKIGQLVKTYAKKAFRYCDESDDEKIKTIESYMDSKNYVPLGDNEQVRMILQLAYTEVHR